MSLFYNILKRSAYLFIIIFLSILFLLALLTFFTPHIRIVPMVGISECESYTNGIVDPNSCNVLPGSLGILVLKNSPLFSYVESPSKFLQILSLYFLVTSVIAIVAAILSFLSGKYILSAIFVAISIAFGIIAITLSAQYTVGDLICYAPPEKNYMVCHTLVKVDEDYIYTASSRYKVLEQIPKDWVVGKIAYILPPVYGKLVYIVSMLSDIAADLYNLITQGNIPKKLTVYYTVEP